MAILSKKLSLLSLSGLEDIIFMIGNFIKRIINKANFENQNIELFNTILINIRILSKRRKLKTSTFLKYSI